MKHKHNLLTILIIALTSTLFIYTACNKDEESANSAPICTITSPKDGTVFTQGETITIAVEAEDMDNNLEEVRFYINDTYIGSASSIPYNFDWKTNEEEPGILTIKAEAIDEAQEKTTDIIEITIEPPFLLGDGVTDYDGNSYNTVIIGNQEWMAENLKTTTYNNGTSIDLVTDNIAWNNNITGAYCWYDNDEAAYADTYGAIYNLHVVNTDNLCPEGWHVPTDAEWTALTDYIASHSHNQFVGALLKATYGWYDNGNGTDDYHFTALPGGMRYYNGAFYGIGNNGVWWSATETDDDFAWTLGLSGNFIGISRVGYEEEYGFSVRCLRD